MSFLRREPATVMAAVQALLALALSFGLDLSTQQIGALLAATAAVLGLVTRSQTYSRYVVVRDARLGAVPGTQPGPTPQGD
jgi:hypothetical protein